MAVPRHSTVRQKKTPSASSEIVLFVKFTLPQWVPQSLKVRACGCVSLGMGKRWQRPQGLGFGFGIWSLWANAALIPGISKRKTSWNQCHSRVRQAEGLIRCWFEPCVLHMSSSCSHWPGISWVTKGDHSPLLNYSSVLLLTSLCSLEHEHLTSCAAGTRDSGTVVSTQANNLFWKATR